MTKKAYDRRDVKSIALTDEKRVFLALSLGGNNTSLKDLFSDNTTPKYLHLFTIPSSKKSILF